MNNHLYIYYCNTQMPMCIMCIALLLCIIGNWLGIVRMCYQQICEYIQMGMLIDIAHLSVSKQIYKMCNHIMNRHCKLNSYYRNFGMHHLSATYIGYQHIHCLCSLAHCTYYLHTMYSQQLLLSIYCIVLHILRIHSHSHNSHQDRQSHTAR